MMIRRTAFCEIQTSDSTCSNSSDEDVTLRPNNCNIIKKDQSLEELLFDIIERIEESDTKLNAFTSLKMYYLNIKFPNEEHSLLT